MRGSIVERKNTKGKKIYYIVVDLPKVPGAKRKQKWFSSFNNNKWTTRKQAEADLPKILVQVQGASYMSHDKVVLAQVIDDYLFNNQSDLAKATYKRYLSCCKAIKDELGHVPIQKVQPQMIQEYFKKLRAKGLQPSTIQKHKVVLQQIFNYAITMQMIQYSPIPKMKIRSTSRTSEYETWSIEQIEEFLRHIKGEPLYIPVLLATKTGMRCGEILGLKWKDVDFDKKTLYVRRAKTFDNSLKTPKNDTSKRPIELMNDLVTELKAHQLSQKKKKLSLGKEYVKSDFICTLDDGTPIKTNYVSKTFPRKVKSLKFPKIRFHDLRHSFATIALANDIHPKVVQEILGHSDIKVTLQTYSHVIPTLHKDSIDKIEKIFKAK